MRWRLKGRNSHSSETLFRMIQRLSLGNTPQRTKECIARWLFESNYASSSAVLTLRVSLTES